MRPASPFVPEPADLGLDCSLPPSRPHWDRMLASRWSMQEPSCEGGPQNQSGQMGGPSQGLFPQPSRKGLPSGPPLAESRLAGPLTPRPPTSGQHCLTALS